MDPLHHHPPSDDGPDLFTAAAQRDRALEIVGENAGDWLGTAVEAIRSVAARQATITSADIWPLVPETREPRAMGAAFVRARAEEIIEPTGLSRATERANARKLTVWASLLYRPNAYEAHGRDKKARAMARALFRLDRDLPGQGSPEPLSVRVAAMDSDFWQQLAKVAGRDHASDATVLRVIELLEEAEADEAEGREKVPA